MYGSCKLIQDLDTFLFREVNMNKYETKLIGVVIDF